MTVDNIHEKIKCFDSLKLQHPYYSVAKRVPVEPKKAPEAEPEKPTEEDWKARKNRYATYGQIVLDECEALGLFENMRAPWRGRIKNLLLENYLAASRSELIEKVTYTINGCRSINGMRPSETIPLYFGPKTAQFFAKYLAMTTLKDETEKQRQNKGVHMAVNISEFLDERCKATNFPADDVCMPPTDAQTCLNTLIKHFLGENWHDVMPESQEQVNTKAVCEIILTRPKG